MKPIDIRQKQDQKGIRNLAAAIIVDAIEDYRFYSRRKQFKNPDKERIRERMVAQTQHFLLNNDGMLEFWASILFSDPTECVRKCKDIASNKERFYDYKRQRLLGNHIGKTVR